MTPRRLLALFAVGILVLGLAAWIATRNPYGPRASIAGTPVLPGLEHSLNAVTEVRIVKAGNVRTTLEKHGDGWIVAERGYPADFRRLRRLLLDLGSLKAIERKTRLAANYPLLGVEDVSQPKATGAEVEVLAPGKTWSIIVGDSADANSGYVRVAGSRQSLLARPLLQVDAKPSLWLDPLVVDVKQARVREIDEQPAKGPRFSVARAAKGQANLTVRGIPRGRELSSPDAPDTMANALSNLTLDDVAKAPPAPRAAALSHAVFRTFGGLEIDVSGWQSDKKHFIELSARGTGTRAAAQAQRIEARARGWEYRIPGYRYSEIFQPLEALLKPLPKPRRAVRHPVRTKKAG
jgi:hypothetical protein